MGDETMETRAKDEARKRVADAAGRVQRGARAARALIKIGLAREALQILETAQDELRAALDGLRYCSDKPLCDEDVEQALIAWGVTRGHAPSLRPLPRTDETESERVARGMAAAIDAVDGVSAKFEGVAGGQQDASVRVSAEDRPCKLGDRVLYRGQPVTVESCRLVEGSGWPWDSVKFSMDNRTYVVPAQHVEIIPEGEDIDALKLQFGDGSRVSFTRGDTTYVATVLRADRTFTEIVFGTGMVHVVPTADLRVESERPEAAEERPLHEMLDDAEDAAEPEPRTKMVSFKSGDVPPLGALIELADGEEAEVVARDFETSTYRIRRARGLLEWIDAEAIASIEVPA